MVDDKKTGASPSSGIGSAAASAKAQATRKSNAAGRPQLSKDEKYGLNIMLQAGRACKILSEKIRNGDMPSSQVMRAASILSGEAAVDLFSDT